MSVMQIRQTCAACRMSEALKQTGIFSVLAGVPIMCNINIGHAIPRCIFPIGVYARVDTDQQVIQFSVTDSDLQEYFLYKCIAV